MQQHKLKEEIVLVHDIKRFAQAYEEISVIRMQATRGQVLKLRTFLDGLGDIYYYVKSSYNRQNSTNSKKSNKNELKIRKNGKNALVFLSANDKFYGDLTTRVFDSFFKDTKIKKGDIYIIGRLGKVMYESKNTHKQFAYFDLPDANFTFENLKPIIASLVSYEQVTLYYGKFINVVTQTAASSNISGEEPFSEINIKTQEIKFMFEPSIEKILSFFEEQFFTSLFKQTAHEAELARYASRIKAMEESLEHIDERLTYLGQEEQRYKNNIQNKKQLEAFSGRSLWIK